MSNADAELCSYCGDMLFDARCVVSAQEMYDFSMGVAAAGYSYSLYVCHTHTDLYNGFYNVLYCACESYKGLAK